MKSKIVSLKDFIEEYLIKQIGEIKDSYPYLACILMSVGLELLGKSINHRPWTESGYSRTDFNTAIRELPKYASLDLYDNLRCNMAHSMRVDSIILTNNAGKYADLPVSDFYADFRKLCLRVAGGEFPNQTSPSEEFFRVEEDELGNAVSGTTKSFIAKK